MALSLLKLTPTRVIIFFFIFLIAYKLLHPSNSPNLTTLSIPASWSTFGLILTTPPPAEPDTLGFLPLSAELDAYCAHHRWRPYPDRYHRRKVYDLVFVESEEELEWLEIRMGEMAKGIDYFVVLESEVVMRGVERWPWRVSVAREDSKTEDKMAKPLHLRENLSKFRRWKDKMLIFTLNLTMSHHGPPGSSPTAYQFDTRLSRKNFINNALVRQTLPFMTEETTPTYGDVIIISEVNEVVRPSVLQILRNCEIPRHVRLWTKRFEGGLGWLGAARPAILKTRPESDDDESTAVESTDSDDTTIQSSTSKQVLFSGQEPQIIRPGLAVGEWNHPDVTFFSGFRDTPLPASLRSDGEAEVLAIPVDDNIHDAGWNCVSCFSSLRAMSERVKAMVVEARGAEEEVNNQLMTLAFPSEIAERVRKGVEVFPELQLQLPQEAQGGVLTGNPGTGNHYLHRVEDTNDVPEFLFEADTKTRKGEYEWLFERDGEDAGFVDYWSLMEELEDVEKNNEEKT